MSKQFEIEEDQITDDYNNGRIDIKEYHRQIHELNSSYQAAAEEAAQDAYDREFNNW